MLGGTTAVDNTPSTSIAIQRAFEQLRQERETFEQKRRHATRWFTLQLIMGYGSIIVLGGIACAAGWVLFNNSDFSGSVITLAATALFVDVLGLVAAVWKIVLNPNFYAPLSPVTRAELPLSQDDSQRL